MRNTLERKSHVGKSQKGRGGQRRGLEADSFFGVSKSGSRWHLSDSIVMHLDMIQPQTPILERIHRRNSISSTNLHPKGKSD